MRYAFVFLIQNSDTRKQFTDKISAIESNIIGVNEIVDREPGTLQVYEYYAINKPGFDPLTNTDKVEFYLVLDDGLSPSFKQPIQQASSKYGANALNFNVKYDKVEMIRRAKRWVGEIGPNYVCYVDSSTVIPADLFTGFKPLLEWYNSAQAETI